jgi:hypothetical protein
MNASEPSADIDNAEWWCAPTPVSDVSSEGWVQVMSAERDSPQRRWTSRARHAILALAILIPLYAASIGPARMLARHYGRDAREFVDMIYAPLMNVADVSGTKRLVQAWVRWWEGLYIHPGSRRP